MDGPFPLMYSRKESKVCPYFGKKARKNLVKQRASIKPDRSKGDKLVRRKGRLYIINKKDPNRKMRQPGRALKR